MGMTNPDAGIPPKHPSPPATYAAWRTAVEQELKGGTIESRLVTPTPEGIAVQPLYRPEDAGNWDPEEVPGRPPFRRGGESPGVDGRRWRAEAEPESYEFSPLPPLALALARPEPRRRATRPAALCLAADPMGWLLRHGDLPMPWTCCLDDLAQGLREAEKAGLPGAVVAVDARIFHESGASAVEELGLALATGAEYWRGLLSRGIAPAELAGRVRLAFAVGVDFFMEIAKLRAARVAWARMSRAFGAPEAAQRAIVAVQTARWDKTVHDPEVNLLRITTEALAAVIAGADAVDIRPFDEVAGRPAELAERMSRNLHDLLADEFACSRQFDPAGGAWYVEAVTDQLAHRAWALFQDIERRGGMAAAVAAGHPQQLVATKSAEKQGWIDLRRRPILGTTVQPNLREAPGRPRRAPATGAARGAVAPKSIKSFGALLGAAAKRSTLPALRVAWAQKRNPGPKATPLKPVRAAEGFEAVRRTGDDYLARTGRRARVFLARMGPARQHRLRAEFSRGFFAAGGFEVDDGPGHATAEEAADGAAASGAAVAVLCSTDETYPLLAPAFARRIKAAKPSLVVVLAGAPGAREREFRAAGFDEFIHLRANVRTTLARLQDLAGMRA